MKVLSFGWERTVAAYAAGEGGAAVMAGVARGGSRGDGGSRARFGRGASAGAGRGDWTGLGGTINNKSATARDL